MDTQSLYFYWPSYKKDIISKTNHLWNNKGEWEKNGRPHPFFRATNDGTEPTLLITPEQILMLTPLVDRSKKDNMSNELRQVVSRLTRSVSNIKVQDKISDLYTRAIDACTKPDHQSAIAQTNCKAIKEKAAMSLKIAEVKQEKASSNSDFIKAIRKHHIRSSSMSKYCVGTALLNENLKQNNFKERILKINKLKK